MVLAVTPALVQYRYGDPAAPALTYVATGAVGTVHWSTDSGGVSPGTGASTTLSALDNDTYEVKVTAHDDNTTVVKTLAVYATFPYQPKWEIESDYDTVGLSRYPMAAEKRTFPEYWDALQFYKRLGNAVIDTSAGEDGLLSYRVVRGKPFYLVEISSGELLLGYFNSALRRSFAAANWCNYSFQFLAINHDPAASPTAGPWVGEL